MGCDVEGTAAVVVVADVAEGGCPLLIRLFMEEAAPELWKLAFLLTFGEGRSLPASELEVVWADPRLSTLQELMSRLRGRLVFILTRRSRVDTLKKKGVNELEEHKTQR